jgi:hypothetical protein
MVVPGDIEFRREPLTTPTAQAAVRRLTEEKRTRRSMKEAADQLIHGGDRIGAVLRAHGGVHLCGGHISPILAGAKARGICVVDVRDEVTVLFAADAVFVADGGDFVATASTSCGRADRAVGSIPGLSARSASVPASRSVPR